MDITELRTSCEEDLYTFACVMFPDRYYGDVHKELFYYFQHGESDYQLALIPRDHQKSHCLAVYAAWKLTVAPWWTFLYVSANPGLGQEQLNVVVDILRSDRHRLLWPEHLNYQKDRDGGTKHKPTGTWTNEVIKLDHPERKARMVRDPSIRVTSVKSSKTGYHCNEVLFDDLVTDENYDSDAEKSEVVKCYKNCTKIMTTGSKAKAVGTRYGEDDLYANMLDLTVPVFEGDEYVRDEKLWTIFERVVEDSVNRSGVGEFLWPRMKMENGEWFGFDTQQLAIKKANMSVDGDISGFYAQYYNDPNDSSLQSISRECFQYLNPKSLTHSGNNWQYQGKDLKLVAAMDLAFSSATARRRDYTAIVVVGMDSDGYLYVLDVDRFQTEKYEVFYDRVLDLYRDWGFKELWVETNNGGKLIKQYLQDQIRKEGGTLKVEGEVASNKQKKEERILQILEPRYRNSEIFHVRKGIIRELESELTMPRPPNDDMKDALALAVSKIKKPLGRGLKKTFNALRAPVSRFGSPRGGRRR